MPDNPDHPAPDQYDTEKHLPPKHNPLPELSESSQRREPTAEDFLAASESPKYLELRKTFRGYILVMTIIFVIWYAVYALLSCYAVDFMATRIGGSTMTIGFVLGLGQFLSTFLIAWLYIRTANNKFDPLSSDLRTELEGAQR